MKTKEFEHKTDGSPCQCNPKIIKVVSTMSTKNLLVIGEWHFKIGLLVAKWSLDTLFFHFGVFKLISHPKEGEMYSKENYKGFWIRKEIKGIECSYVTNTK